MSTTTSDMSMSVAKTIPSNASLKPPSANQAAPGDERVRRISPWRALLNRPELGSIAATSLVFVFFGVFAGNSGMFNLDGIMNWSQVAAYLGIIAVGACLLMIAGEFDLSLGSMIGFAGMVLAVPSMYFGWPMWLSMLFAFVVCMALGWLNGYLVMRTKLPSFIVTLAFMFILRGLTIVLSTQFAGSTIISGVGDKIAQDPVTHALFQGNTFQWLFTWLAHVGVINQLPGGEPVVAGLPKVLRWWSTTLPAKKARTRS